MAPSQDEPKPGDLIEIFRFGYTHWALYVGDGYVVHLTSTGTSEPTGTFRRIHILGFRNEEPESRGSCDFSKGTQAGVGLCLSLKPGRGPAFPQLVLTDEAQGSGAACLPTLSPDHRPLSSLGTTDDITGAALAKLMSSGTQRAIVKKQLLSVVAGKDKYRVNNENDDKYPPLPPSEIVQCAEEKVGQEVDYKLTSENCEDFVNELRYGVHRSNQVIEAVLAVGLVILGAAIGPVVGIPAGVAAGIVVTAVAIRGVLRYLWNKPKHAKRN